MKVYQYKPKTSNSTPTKPASRSPKSWQAKIKRFLKNLPWPIIGTWAFRVGAGGVLLIAFFFIYYSKDLPDPNRLLGRNVPESTKIYARDETLLYEVHGEFKRTLIELDQVSPNLKNATIAVEDKNFYNHSGISITGLMRSVIVDIIYREKRQGGSTITQQFIKNAVLTRDKSFTRKIKEIILSIQLEARFSKDEILKLYLNEIPYGRNAYGIQAASQTYFNKSASELTLAQSAYLAALPQAPSFYNPSGPNFEALTGRQKFILQQMKDEKYITEEEMNQALNETVEFQQIKSSIKAPHFVQYVQGYLAEKYGEATLEEGGLKVYTTLDSKLQEIAEKAVTEGAAKNKAYGGNNAALVAVDPKTGQILAMVGSKDYFGEIEPANCVPGKSCTFEPNVNITTTWQQPGSSFKPFAYVTAFGKDHGYAPGSVLMDVVTNFGNYTPKNFNLSQSGPVSMRKALAGSLNIPAVKTISLVGENKVVETARNLGIEAPFTDCGLSLVLGGCDVKLVDHTVAYATLANGGKKMEKTSILKVVSQDGETLEEYEEKSNQVLDPQAVYLLQNIMTDNAARAYVFGSNSALTLGNRPVAAKTGTTQDFRDGWTMGFTPSLAAGVWVGNNNNAPMNRDAVITAGPIWNKFMREALADTPIEEFPVPDGITKISIDAVSGKLPTEYSKQVVSEVFASYSVPTKYDDVNVPVKVDVLTGLPADDSTPPERVVVEVYTALHSERRGNPAWESPVIAWALANGYKYPPGSGITNPTPGENGGPDIAITSPQNNSTISSLPFSVTAVSNSSEIAKVEFLINGEVVATSTEAPYEASISKVLPNGSHIVSARTTGNDGKNSTNSVTVKYALEESLSITEPSNNSEVSNGNITLTAESNTKFDSVTFYYIQGNQNRTIGSADAAQIGSNYEYSYDWLAPSGNYRIYARSSNDTTSSRINLTVQ